MDFNAQDIVFLKFNTLNFFKKHHKVMKKPITIVVIAVIATILVTSAVDYSAIGAKPLDQIHLETASGINNGIISCPNGDTIIADAGSVRYTEFIEAGNRGRFILQNNLQQPQEFYSVTLWTGEIQSGEFVFMGIGNSNFNLTEFCDIPFPAQRTIVTVWGECGEDVTVHFEAESGYSGSFTGTIICV